MMLVSYHLALIYRKYPKSCQERQHYDWFPWRDCWHHSEQNYTAFCEGAVRKWKRRCMLWPVTIFRVRSGWVLLSIVEGWPLGLKWDLPFWGMFKQTQNPWHPATYIDKSWSHVPVMVLWSRTDRKNMYYRGNLLDWLAGCTLGKQTVTGYS